MLLPVRDLTWREEQDQLLLPRSRKDKTGILESSTQRCGIGYTP